MKGKDLMQLIESFSFPTYPSYDLVFSYDINIMHSHLSIINNIFIIIISIIIIINYFHSQLIYFDHCAINRYLLL